MARRRLDRDLDAEIAFHLDMRTDEGRRRGESLSAAAAGARRRFGNATAQRETTRDLWTFMWLESVVRDVRLSLRLLARQPGFAIVAILTLAVGIGATAAIFSFVDAVLLRPLPYPDADRIVVVWERPPQGLRNPISTMNFLDWQRTATSFSSLTATTGEDMTLGGRTELERLHVARVSPSYFDTYGIHPLYGPGFDADADTAGNEHVVVLQHKTWVSRFGADRSIIGRAIILDGHAFTVVGITPEDSPFERGFSQAWVPMAFTPGERNRDSHWLQAVGRLKSGVTLDQAQAELTEIGARIATAYPASNKGWSVFIEPYSGQVVSVDLAQSLYVLFGAVGMLLLVGAVNLANLTLARGLTRGREVAVRAALGAGRRRLIRQFVTENLVLAVVGGVAGVALGYALMAALRGALPDGTLPRESMVVLDTRVVVFAFALSLVTGVCFGLVPAMHATKPDLTAAMKDGARGGTSDRSRRRTRSMLVVVEIALAFVLVAGAGLLLRSFDTLSRLDTGFDDHNVVTVGLPHGSRPVDPDHLVAFYDEVLARVEAVPGVASAGLTLSLPLNGWGFHLAMHVVGSPEHDPASRSGVGFKMVSRGYFETLKIRLIKGRTFTAADRRGTPPVMIVNTSLADAIFPGQDPIGQRLAVPFIASDGPRKGAEVPWEIVGVIADENVAGLDQPLEPGMYVPLAQNPFLQVSLVVRSQVDSATTLPGVRAAVHAVDPQQLLTDVAPLATLRRDATVQQRLETGLLAAFAALGLGLAAIGIYGVMSYSVAQRTREIGIRTALGATGRSVLRLVLVDGLRLAAVGLVIGLVGALLLSHALKALLFGVTPRDPLTLVVSVGVLGAIALLACAVPARRAMRLDPVEALRGE